MEKEIKASSQALLDFLNASPTPFQSCDNLSEMLEESGALKISENEAWSIEKSKTYYFTKGGTQIAAFCVNGEPKTDGFRIGCAHHDSPGFRIKTVPSKCDLGYERIMLEGYGGLIVHGWLDRPLALAGRVFVRDENGAKAMNINIDKPLCIIPSAAIHVMRDVNNGEKFNLQTEMLPFFAQNSKGEVKFTQYIADTLGVNKEDIVSYELALYDANPGCFVGMDEEFISVARLDDAAMAHALVSGFNGASKHCDIAVVFDHEEIGSSSDRGAKSNTIMMIIDRICEKLGTPSRTVPRAGNSWYSPRHAHATHRRI